MTMFREALLSPDVPTCCRCEVGVFDSGLGSDGTTLQGVVVEGALHEIAGSLADPLRALGGQTLTSYGQ